MNISSKKISIITIVKNDLIGIKKTVQSVRAQTWRNFEHIIIDGASCDGTIEWLSQLNTKPTVLISEVDNGIYAAMNKGLQNCQGVWVYFLNAGEVFTTDTALEQIVSVMNNRIDIVYFDMVRVDLQGRRKLWKQKKPIRLGLFKNICHQALFYNRELCQDLVFNENLRVGADCDLLLKLLHQPQKRVLKKINKPLATFTLGGISQRQAHVALKEREESFQRYIEHPGLRALNHMNLTRQKVKLWIKRQALLKL